MDIFRFLLSFTALLGSIVFADENAKAVTTTEKVGNYSFSIPKEWKKIDPPSSRMVQLELTIQPDQESKDELSAKFYYFGEGQGGSADANIKRWIGQFEAGAKSESRKVEGKNGRTITHVYVEGTYLDGPPFGGPKVRRENYQLHGCIIEGDGAPVFIKVTGPTKSVKEAKGSIEAMAESALK